MNRRNFIGLSTLAVSSTAVRGAADEPAALTFGLITDVQYADAGPEGERHYRESIPKLKTAVGWLAERKLRFTLHLGDFIDREFKSFGDVLPLLDGLGHPVRHLLGNHDYTVADGEKCRIVTTLGMPHDYYVFRDSGVRFVMLDTNDRSVYKYPADSSSDRESESLLKDLVAKNSSAAKPWNGGISDDQLEWLERELAAADAVKERVILCGHHPLLPADGHQVWNSEAVLAVIDRHPSVAAFFNGHNHAGAEVIRNGIPYITFKSILHEPEVNAFSAIRLFADRLEIEGNGRETSRVIPLRKV
ncbi:metallophosphoesterase [Luteolibacter yonseiensis]|uniref:Metallophosphoesterase n=1 Tax=Luteolibacter yonseiensis TaxID=1144680 RepID=A0A934R4B8_9BACT|nr:metallophosphoesterase [Luteolibacter yonseiensis]MBK1814939.1 metallophosphoesterase [Luteolibacter yonseiensis]